MTIFYYTATGSSLEVTKKLGGKYISIPAVLKGDTYKSIQLIHPKQILRIDSIMLT